MTIRRIPEDFLVNEVLDPRFLAALRPEPDALARGALYRLTKVSMTTPDAARDLARTLGVKVPDVTYAGLKDRHARTVQHVRVESRPGLRLPTVVAGASWNAELLGYTSEPLDAGRIERNRFEIVVRGLSRKASQEMLRRARLLSMETPEADSVALLIANYFGAQRFGSARHGQGWIAEALIRGDFEHALRLAIGTPSRKDSGATRNFTRACAARWGDWVALAQSLPRLPERLAIEKLAHGSGFRDAFAALPYFLQMMSVEAYQSLLWNGTLRAMVSRANQGSEEDLIRADDEFGEMLFLDSSSIPRAWLELSIPMPAPDVSPSEPWGAHMLAELRARHLTLDDLRIPGLRRPFFGAALRPAFVHAASFALSGEQRDDLSRDPHARKRHVSFELPRGAYATVVLRALGQ